MEIERKIKQIIVKLKYKFWHSRLAWYDDSHEIKLTSLSPSENIEDNDSNIDAYEIALRNVLKSTDANNIAMTGDLGIGKSSILKAYEKRYGEKFIYVSVSDLIDDSQPPEKKKTPEEKKKIQEEIEKNLLKQLIAVCRKKDIPASRFRHIPESPSKRNAILFTILTAIFALNIGVVLFWDEIAEAFETFHICIDKGKPFSYFFLVVLSTILVGCSIWNIILNYKLPKISAKASVKDGCEANIEMDTPIEPENLDKNLGEIIYLLEQAGKKSGYVLVIEDMDRFDADVCIPVLVKLRQINVMINQRMRFSNHKHSYKFIYVLKEEIFADKDPYKFFDIMLPVVPSLSNKSSTIYLKDRWEEFDLLPTFIPHIAPFLTDYRKIFNIENEYKVFSKIHGDYLSSIEDRKIRREMHTELMALMIYKAYFPDDYYQIRYANENSNNTPMLTNELKDKWLLNFSRKAFFSLDSNNIFNVLAFYMSQRVFNFIGTYTSSAVAEATRMYKEVLVAMDRVELEFRSNYSAMRIETILNKMGNKIIFPDTMQIVMNYFAKVMTLYFRACTKYRQLEYNETYIIFHKYGLYPHEDIHAQLLRAVFNTAKKDAEMAACAIADLYRFNAKNFIWLDFTGADLSKTSFKGMTLDLSGVHYDDATIFPEDGSLDPDSSGMIYVPLKNKESTSPETNDSESTAPIT